MNEKTPENIKRAEYILEMREKRSLTFKDIASKLKITPCRVRGIYLNHKETMKFLEENTHKWYRNLPVMALNVLSNNDLLEDPEKVKELCRSGEIKRLRNCGKVMFTQICIALGITVHSKVSNSCCPHCGKSFGIQFHKLKASEAELE